MINLLNEFKALKKGIVSDMRRASIRSQEYYPEDPLEMVYHIDMPVYGQVLVDIEIVGKIGVYTALDDTGKNKLVDNLYVRRWNIVLSEWKDAISKNVSVGENFYKKDSHAITWHLGTVQSYLDVLYAGKLYVVQEDGKSWYKWEGVSFKL